MTKKSTLGLSNGTQRALRRPNGSQKASKRLPKELPKSMILGFWQETSENVKIALPSRRQCNFQGSGTLEKRQFGSFSGVKLRVQSGTHQRWSKNGTPGCLGGSREGSKGEKGFHQGPPRRSPGTPRGSKIESKSRSFSQWPKVGSKTSPRGRPGDHLGSIFGDFGIDVKQYLVSLLVSFWGILRSMLNNSWCCFLYRVV